MQEIIHELQKQIQGEVRFDRYSRILYSTDASIYEIEPLGVVIPKSLEDVQATVELANRHQIAIIPRGGGTSLVGQSIGAGIIIDFSKYLHKIVEVNPKEKWARVQPGVVLDQLNNHLKQFDLFFGPDVATSSRANLGGLIGNNSSGAHSILYGKTIDHVLGLNVFLSNGEIATLEPTHPEVNGTTDFLNQIYQTVNQVVEKNRAEIIKRFPKILRRVGGYNLDEFITGKDFNLAKMIVGSEGTLAVVGEAKLNLVPLVKHRVLGVIHFDDLFIALDAVSPILEFKPSAIELIDDIIISLTRGTMEYARRLNFVEGQPKALLLVEFQSDNKKEIVEKLDELIRFLSKEKLGYAHIKAIEDSDQEDAWFIRKAGLGLLMGSKDDRRPIGFIEDSAVAPEKLGSYIREFDSIIRRHQTHACYYAHASVGCLHIRPMLNLKKNEDLKRMASTADEVSNLALKYGGAMSGEHGDGLARSCWNEKMFGSKLYDAFREIKKAFDPKNILNPGKIVDAQFLTDNLRKHADPQLQITPFFDYSKEEGFQKAIEICNGNGVCRKKDSGTMCPSYMVTMEEEHSTRGRANALRAILNGQLDKDELTSQRMYDVFDLCITCKGCKGECPSNVDMAKLKYEFLYHYHQANGLPLRDRIFGNIATVNQLGCKFAPFSNWLTNRLPIRWLMHTLLGIDCHRRLPDFAQPDFESWFKKQRKIDQNGNKKVVLFNDTFMNYNYPEIGKATVKLLGAVGYDVILAEKKCCGRPLISKGMLDKAKKYAEHNVETLYPLIEKGYSVVGCEPSCILTFRDEYPDMLKDSRVRAVAQNSFLIEEFLSNETKSASLKFREMEQKFLLHGHCHMKALVGLKATIEMLKLIPGAEVEVVDSGCCGMAGSFGFEKEHYQVSMAMGRRKLFEAVESKGRDWQIVAPGVSCRQQIEQGTGRKAKHPVEVLAEHLV